MNFFVKPKLNFFSKKSSDESTISEVPLTFLHMKYPDEPRYAIVTLVTNATDEVEKLCTALKSLTFLRGDVPGFPAPVLVFNEGDLSPEQLQSLVGCSVDDRALAFPTVDFGSFPEGFDPEEEEPLFRVEGRSKWGYYQMIRFWISGIWKHEALEPFDIVMRIDSDSCFKSVNEYLPRFRVQSAIYHSQYVGMASEKKYLEGLYDFAVDWLASQDMPPTNTLMWHMVKSNWERSGKLPVFMTNFEIIRKKFMQHPEVRKWQDALTEHEPFGIYRHRWSDSVVRFLTASMFIQTENIMTSQAEGYHHRKDCAKKDVEKALKSFKG